MPIIQVVKGDLIKMFKNDEVQEIAHGCNCFHTMGSGIAGQIAQEFPQALAEDKETKYGDPKKLGSYSLASVGLGFINNLYTQFYPGRVKVKKDLYAAIENCFVELNNDAPTADKWLMGIPLIGAGIAGGNWKTISKIIDDVTPRMKIIVVEYQP